jgi:hypothetical protein
MKRIIFYCGALMSESDVFTGEVYVRNAPEYLAMTDEERVVALTGLIAEMSQELEFVSRQISSRGTSSKGRGLPQ